MKQVMLHIIFTLILACSVCLSQTDEVSLTVHSQAETLQEKVEQVNQLSKIISEIEKALQNNSAEELSHFFTKKISISLRGTESGTFSANQGYYIIREFFAKQKLTNFRFTSKGTSGDELYATGGGTLFIRGKREVVQIYVGFLKSGSSYLITQFNIY